MFEHKPKHILSAKQQWSDETVSFLDEASESLDAAPESPVVEADNAAPTTAPQPPAPLDPYGADTLERRLKSKLQQMLVTDTTLARDLAIFGDTHLEEILAAYEIEKEWLIQKMQEEKFLALIQQYRLDVEKDSKGLLRARAMMYLETQTDIAHQIAINPYAADRDRLKAIEFTSKIADAIPRNLGDGNQGTGSALNVVFNFGNQNPHNEQLREIIVGESNA